MTAGNDTLTNIQNIRGSAFNDTLTGDGADNVIEGGEGNDTIDGGGGNNTASYEHAAAGVNNAGVTVSLAVAGPQDTGSAGTDTLSNIANLIGSAYNDILIGNNNANILTGGGGNDTFVFNPNNGSDTITDFQQGQDTIELAGIFSSETDTAFTDLLSTLQSAADGDHTIDFGGGNTITLAGINVNTLHVSDFFVHL